MDNTWTATFLQWGAYGVGAIAMAIANITHKKFEKLDEKIDSAFLKIDINEKLLIEHQLDASRRYVDKQEYLNTLNRMYDKLDSIDKSINTLNSTMGGIK